MMKFKIFFLCCIICLFLSSCLNIIASIHKKPKINKDFELYDKAVMDSLYNKLGNYFYISDTINYYNFLNIQDSLNSKNYTEELIFFFDSLKIIWTNADGNTVWSEQKARDFSVTLKKYTYSFGVASKKEYNYKAQKKGNYQFQIADGSRGDGWRFLYFDAEILSDGKIKLILRSYKKFNKRVRRSDPLLPFYLKKELIFTPIKIK